VTQPDPNLKAMLDAVFGTPHVSSNPPAIRVRLTQKQILALADADSIHFLAGKQAVIMEMK
jgi:hypothetical protein